MTLQPPDVVGPGEACALLKMSRPTFSRHKIRPDFPPAAALECGDVYERRAIVAYGKQRDTGKPYLLALAAWREHHRFDQGRLAVTRRTLEAHGYKVTDPTIRRWLQQLGEIER